MRRNQRDLIYIAPLTKVALVYAISLISTVAAPIYAQGGGPIIIGEHQRLEFFGIENFKASMEAYWRYRNDDSTDSNGVKSSSTESLFRESIIFDSKAYLGDPNLVTLKLHLDLRLSQENLKSSSLARTERTSELLSEYDISALVLQRSDLPFTIYSRQTQALLDRQFADSLDSITTEHGARISLQSDVMPNQFHYFHREQEQTSSITGTESRLAQDSFTWQGSFIKFKNQRFWWDYTFSNIDESGLLQVSNSFARHDAFVNHTYDFGADNNYHLRSSLRIFKETGKFPIDRLRINEILRLEHKENFETKYAYLFDQQERRGTTQTLHKGTASFRHDLFDSLTTTGQIGTSQLDLTTDNFESTQYFGDLGLKYQKIVPKGMLYATADVNFNHQDDADRGSTIIITNEPHTFAVSGLIILSRRNIITTSVVITDATGIIIYVEGADYSVTPFADSIEIRRIITGSIAAGQSVLVRYEIGPEPASTTDTTGVGFTLRYRFQEGPLSGLSPYLRYRNQIQDRTSASLLLLAQNDFDDLVLGVDYDLGKFSLTAEHQIHDSTLSPFEITRFEGRYINRINSTNSISFNAYYQQTDRTDIDIQTTITNVTTRWSARPSQKIRSSLVAIWRKEADNSGLDSDAFEIVLDLAWKHRQTSAYCTIRNSMVDSNTRDSTFQTFIFGIRREF